MSRMNRPGSRELLMIRRAFLPALLLALTASAPLHAEGRTKAGSPAPRSPDVDRTTAPSTTKIPAGGERGSGYVGVVFAYRTADVTSEIAGVNKRCVRLGDRVEAG